MTEFTVRSGESIQEAIRAAMAGDTVSVMPGTYVGMLNVSKPLVLRALDENGKQVNPSSDPHNTDWPVELASDAGNALQITNGVSNVLVHGFHILRAAGNGIHIKGVYDNGMRKVAQHIRITGCWIENTVMDGIKVNHANDTRLTGNRIENVSLVTLKNPGQLEHGIDFMCSGNVYVARNLFGKCPCGLTVKGGTSAVLIEGNDFQGPFKWTAISGEPIGKPHLPCATWTARRVRIRNNRSDCTGQVITVRGWHEAAIHDNDIAGSVKIVNDEACPNRDVYIANTGPVSNFQAMALMPMNIPNWTASKLVTLPDGSLDIIPG